MGKRGVAAVLALAVSTEGFAPPAAGAGRAPDMLLPKESPLADMTFESSANIWMFATTCGEASG